MNVLLWHVHGSWTTAFVSGNHRYIVPVDVERSPDGRGRARTWDWPSSVVERTAAELRDTEIDIVLLQRPHEAALCKAWLGKQPGKDLPAIYLEHNAPEGAIDAMDHPVKDGQIPLVHVTHFNATFWDAGKAPVYVIEHGIVDPGMRYTGEIAGCAVVSNEMHRRGRVVGADIFAAYRRAIPTDLFGMDAARFGGFDDLRQDTLHTQIARRRFYLHTTRWTSLGLSLIEAMHLGMPIVAYAATDVVEAVPPQCGVISTNMTMLIDAGRAFLADAGHAAAAGRNARDYALQRYGLQRFLNDWDAVLEEAVS